MTIERELMHCRVCGLLQAEEPWGPTGTDPTWAICDCCGTEFGYEDSSVAAANGARERWISSGAKWFRPEVRTSDWSLDAQLAQVPEKYR